MTAPASVYTTSQRRRIEEQVYAEGLQCAVDGCGRDARPDEIEQWVRVELWGEPEPQAWTCPDGIHICGDCLGEGRPRGLSGPEVCCRCGGQGEWDEADSDLPWPPHPSERDL